jgi:REP element-mobilizing transposase RayT
MKYNPEKHHRRSIRLKGYDYSQPGGYYVTIVTQNRECLFGDIVDGKMILNDGGRFTQKCWLDISNHFPHVYLDEFIIMPNHVHGIIIIDDEYVGAKNFSPLPFRSPSKTVGSIIRGFKIGVTKWFRNNTDVYTVWQRNYWEHVIRDENELNRIREYIMNNPLQWELDEENPKKIVDKKRFDKIKFEEHQCRKTI